MVHSLQGEGMLKYRVVVCYSEEKKSFFARAPELEGCEAEGETRAEAISRLEDEMTAQVENMRQEGMEPPPSLDEQTFDGQLSLKVTPGLHRDLVFLARGESVELPTLLTELLARGLSGGRPSRDRPRQEQRGRREGQGQRYHEIMDNRENFIDYVRRLDGGGGGRGGGGRPAGGGGGRGRR